MKDVQDEIRSLEADLNKLHLSMKKRQEELARLRSDQESDQAKVANLEQQLYRIRLMALKGVPGAVWVKHPERGDQFEGKAGTIIEVRELLTTVDFEGDRRNIPINDLVLSADDQKPIISAIRFG